MKKEKLMPSGELTEEEYHQLVVLPNRARTRARMDHITQVRAENFHKAQKIKRKEKASRSLFEIYNEESGGNLFD